MNQGYFSIYHHVACGRYREMMWSQNRDMIFSTKYSFRRLEEHSILRMPHSPYSLDLVFNDFYLFPTVKERPERIRLANEDQFFECLQGVLRGLDQQELNTAFQTWVGRVQEVCEGNGDYVG
jgi:hypothetical protein